MLDSRSKSKVIGAHDSNRCGFFRGQNFSAHSSLSVTGVNLVELKRGFRSACDDAGIQDFRFHDLRHTTGTRLADAGTDAFAIAEVLGHRDLQTTKRYTHATELRKRRAVEALASYGEDGQKMVKDNERVVA